VFLSTNKKFSVSKSKSVISRQGCEAPCVSKVSLWWQASHSWRLFLYHPVILSCTFVSDNVWTQVEISFKWCQISVKYNSSSGDEERQKKQERSDKEQQLQNRGILKCRFIYSWKRRVFHTHIHFQTLQAILVLLLNNATALRSEGLLLY